MIEVEFEELGRILEVDARGTLSRRVLGEYTEYDIVEAAIKKASTLTLSNRAITVSGLSRNMDIIIKALAEFKEKEKRNVAPQQYAKADEIALEVGIIRPEYFGLDTYLQTGLSVGTYHIIPTGAGAFSIPDKNLCIITDLIELQPTANVTSVLFADIDGTQPVRPLGLADVVKITDMHLYELAFPVMADLTMDLDGKVEASGDSEIAPVGAWICLGRDIKELT